MHQKLDEWLKQTQEVIDEAPGEAHTKLSLLKYAFREASIESRADAHTFLRPLLNNLESKVSPFDYCLNKHVRSIGGPIHVLSYVLGLLEEDREKVSMEF